MRVYLLVFDDADLDRKTVTTAIDRIPEIENWYAFFGNTMCLSSAEDVKRLADRIGGALPNMRFIVTAVEPDQKGGRMPKSVLSFMNAPVPAGVEPV